MSLCGLPGCSNAAYLDKQTCRFHIGMERFIAPPNLGNGMTPPLAAAAALAHMQADLVKRSETTYPVCKFCGERHRRVSLDDACSAEWAGVMQSQNAVVRVDSTAQPAPKPSTGPALWELVEKDMQSRDNFGKHKYGIRLQPHNGRDFLVDAYQEALDLVVYLRGVMYERDGK